MKKFRYIIGVLTAVISVLVMALPVYAIANPDDISFGTATSTGATYRAFYNVVETGDMLFMAESYIHYAATPTESAESAFLFELLNNAGTTIYASTPVFAYEDKPVSIYLTEAQKTALALVNGSEYKLRISGNPLLFPSLVEGTNMATVTLVASDWFNQNLNSAGVLSPLRAFALNVMTNIQTHDAPADDYIVTVSGTEYITDTGANIMLAGVVGLDVWCPQIFQFAVAPIVGEAPPSTGDYANTLSPLGQLGAQTASGINLFGQWLGLGTNGVMASALIYLGISLMALVWIGSKIQSPLVLPIGGLALIAFGSYLGFIPLAVLFMIIALIVILTAVYFFTRGSW